MVDVAQLVRVLDCGSRGRRFKSGLPPHKYRSLLRNGIFLYTFIFPDSIFASSIAFIFYANGIQKIGAGKASIFSNTIPVFTAIFSFIIPGDMITIQIISGIIIVIGGLLLSQMTRRKILKSPRRIKNNID